MNYNEIKNLSSKKIKKNNLNEIKNSIKNNYEISYGKYSSGELKKAIKKQTPFFIQDHFIIGYNQDGTFLSDQEENIKIERMVKAVIVEEEISPFEKEIEEIDERDLFVIIEKNNWENKTLSEFNNILGHLKVGEVFLPPHSAVFNFLKPSEKEIKDKIVSCLSGASINVYSPDNYVDNCIHEIGHLFWRDRLTFKEKKSFEDLFKILKTASIYEYDWERSDQEEVFCTIYKWYVKSILMNKSFLNILQFEEPTGLRLLQEICERIAKEKITEDIWNLKKDDLFEYLNPRFDKTLGKKIVKKGLFDEIRDIEIPRGVLQKSIKSFENGSIYVELNKAILPVKDNRIDFYTNMKKAIELNNPTIYMDLDGVIADFDKGYKDLFNRDCKKDDSFTVNQFCMQEPHFFRMLPVHEKGLELFNSLKNKYNIYFLTTPMKGMEYCMEDKIEWIKENLGEYDVFFADNKSDFVDSEESILIDDMKSNIDDWRDAGGTAIRFPQKLEKITLLIEETLNPIKEIKKIKAQIKNIDVELNPTEAQKISGIYKKGTINFKDLVIKIENPKGSIRWGFDEYGKKWVNRMKCHYGYISRTEGADFDPVDVFIGPHLNKSIAFVVNQVKDGAFDEHKIMLGYKTIEEAEKAYFSNYQKNWDGLGSIKQTNTKKLRDWLNNGNLNEPY